MPTGHGWAPSNFEPDSRFQLPRKYIIAFTIADEYVLYITLRHIQVSGTHRANSPLLRRDALVFFSRGQFGASV